VRIDVHLTAAADERDEAGDTAVLDVPGHHFVHPIEPDLRQSGFAHVVSFVACTRRDRLHAQNSSAKFIRRMPRGARGA
jgi:hypothetical protein